MTQILIGVREMRGQNAPQLRSGIQLFRLPLSPFHPLLAYTDISYPSGSYRFTVKLW